jgi:hypothetical protein
MKLREQAARFARLGSTDELYITRVRDLCIQSGDTEGAAYLATLLTAFEQVHKHFKQKLEG